MLSFVWPGLGQIYNGQIGSGLFVMFVFVICLALFPLVFPPFIGLLLWGYGIFEAHSTAERLNRRGR